MLQKSLLVTTATILMTGASLAADLPSRRAPPVYVPPPVPVFTWAGPYIGLNAGYAFTDNQGTRTIGNNGPGAAPTQAPFNTDTVTNVTTGRRTPFISQGARGFTGGLQIGYNYQMPGIAGVVVGVEADAAYTDLRNSSNFLSTQADPSTFRQRLQYLGTVRGRVGYAFDRILIYGTGGFAYGGSNASASFFSNSTGALAYFGRTNRIETGYAYGGGVEYALPTTSFVNFLNSSAVTIKAEYIHYDLGSRAVLVNNTGLATVNGSYTTRFRNEGNLVRAGLNFKFGGPVVAPVVARY